MEEGKEGKKKKHVTPVILDPGFGHLSILLSSLCWLYTRLSRVTPDASLLRLPPPAFRCAHISMAAGTATIVNATADYLIMNMGRLCMGNGLEGVKLSWHVVGRGRLRRIYIKM